MVLVTALVAVTALAVSCVRELEIRRPVNSDNAAIRLTPVCVGPVTKAAPEDGDDDYNENLISNYYWFIYSDAEGNTLKLSGYVSDDSSTEILLDDAFPNGGTGYVYVVANIPSKPATPVEGDEWLEYNTTAEQYQLMVQGENEATPSDCTFANLKTLEFGKNTPVSNNSIVAGKSEFYTYTSATTGVPDPEKFVMRTTALKDFTLVEKTVVDVTAELKRVAAKLILDLNVAKEVEQTHTNAAGQEEYTKTWFSDIEHIQIYMLWGSTHGNLAGEPVRYSTNNKDWFYFASPRYAMYREPDGGNYNASTNTVEGAIPEDWYEEIEYPVEYSNWEVVFQIRQNEQNEPIWLWNSTVPEAERIPENEGNPSYGDWDYLLWLWNSDIAEDDKINKNIGNLSYGSWDPRGEKVPAFDANGNIQRKLVTRTKNEDYYAISSIPMYSMPIEWNVNDAHAPFIKIILPWQGYDKNTGQYDMSGSARKTTEFFYKVLVPNRTTLDANGCYHISLDLSVLGSEADEVPVAVNGEYHVVDWNAPVAIGGNQSAGRYLNVARTSYDMYSNTLSIPVSASGNIVIQPYGGTGTNPTGTYINASSGNTGNLTYSANSSTGTNFKITPDPLHKYVQVDHEVLPFSTSFTTANAKDVAVITYRFRVALEGYESTFYKDITVTQYPSIYAARRQSSGSPFVNGFSSGEASNRNTYSLGSVGANGSRYNTIVSISTLSGLTNPDVESNPYRNWVIGDPRIRLANAYNGRYSNELSYHNDYAEGTNDSEWRRSDLGDASDYFDNYLVGDKDASNFIAPKFMLASGYGYNQQANSGNWKKNSERCATYQEDGYPAGRWRLPTEAELLFCAVLANKGLIENPYVSTVNYSASSGRFLYYVNNSTNWDFVLPTSGLRSVRCVYDLWYWGDATATTPGSYRVMLPE